MTILLLIGTIISIGLSLLRLLMLLHRDGGSLSTRNQARLRRCLTVTHAIEEFCASTFGVIPDTSPMAHLAVMAEAKGKEPVTYSVAAGREPSPFRWWERVLLAVMVPFVVPFTILRRMA